MVVLLITPDDIDMRDKYAWLCLKDCYTRKEEPIQYDIISDRGRLFWNAWCNKADKLVLYTDLGITDMMFNESKRFLALGRVVQFRNLPQDLLKELQQ